MPVIPAMTPQTGEVDIASIFVGGLFNPVNPPDSLEILNGGLDEDNYGGGDNSIPMTAVQIGSFAAAYSMPTTRMEVVYAKSFLEGGRTRQNDRAGIAGLGARFFLPWTAKGLIYYTQAFWQHDATQWSDGVSQHPEKWDVKTYVDRAEDTSIYQRLGPTRLSTGMYDNSGGVGWDGVAGTPGDPGLAYENRWRFMSTLSGFESGSSVLDKGSHIIQVTLHPTQVFAKDPKIAKTYLGCASIGVLAFR